MQESFIWIFIGAVVLGGFALMALPRLSTAADKRRMAGAGSAPLNVGDVIELGGGKREVYLGTSALNVHVIAAALKERGLDVEVVDRTPTSPRTKAAVSLRYQIADQAEVRAEIARGFGRKADE